MLEIKIKQNNNGYVYEISGQAHRLAGEYVCKNTEEFEMLEKIGEIICGHKIKVERR